MAWPNTISACGAVPVMRTLSPYVKYPASSPGLYSRLSAVEVSVRAIKASGPDPRHVRVVEANHVIGIVPGNEVKLKVAPRAGNHHARARHLDNLGIALREGIDPRIVHHELIKRDVPLRGPRVDTERPEASPVSRQARPGQPVARRSPRRSRRSACSSSSPRLRYRPTAEGEGGIAVLPRRVAPGHVETRRPGHIIEHDASSD